MQTTLALEALAPSPTGADTGPTVHGPSVSPLVAVRQSSTIDRYRAIWRQLPQATRARYADLAEGRIDIKPYQLEGAALTAFKKSAINAFVMGAGKTLMAIFHAYAIGANRTAVIAPTRLLPTWKRECARVGVPCVSISNATDARRIYRDLWLARKQGRSVPFTFYVLSWEWLSLGGESNQVVDPWYAKLSLDDDHQRALESIETWTLELFKESVGTFLANLTPEKADRVLEKLHRVFEQQVQYYDSVRGAEKLAARRPVNCIRGLRALFDLQLLELDRKRSAVEAKVIPPLPIVKLSTLFPPADKEAARGYRPGVSLLCEAPTVELLASEYRRMGVPFRKGQSYRYEAHHPVCPKCSARTPEWKGTHCANPECRYEPRAYLGSLLDEQGSPRERTFRKPMSTERHRFKCSRTSNRSFPGYRLLPTFDLKIVEEFHKAVSLHTLHGRAIFDVKARETLLLSGTICRSYVTELEPALSLVHDQQSPEFPYARHDLSDFRERFSSYATRLSIARPGRPRILSRTTIPEASNINALRRILHQRMVTIEESIVDAEWGLRTLPERVVPFSLLPEEIVRYNETLSSVLSWREQLVGMIESGDAQQRTQAQNALLRGARNRLDLISAITNGPSKVRAAVAWAQEEAITLRHRCVVVCRSVALFNAIADAFRRNGIEHVVLDEKVDNADRDEFLTNFAASSNRILLTRIKLVCEGFNQLVCCTRMLMCEVERSPSDNRQMQRRLNRPGQQHADDLRCDLLVARLPDRRASIDEVDIRRFLRKERAIKEVTGRAARFRGAAALLEASQRARGMVMVLDDLASQVLSEIQPEPPSTLTAPTEAPDTGAFASADVAGTPADAVTTTTADAPASPPVDAPQTVVTDMTLDWILEQVPCATTARHPRAQKPKRPAPRRQLVQAELF